MADKTTEMERIYTIPLRKTKDLTRSRRAQLAVRDVQRYLVRHMKADRVWVDNSVNEELWSQGKFKIPSRIRVRATRFSDGVVEVTLPESTQTGSMRDQIAARREKAAESPVLKAPEPEEGEATGPGAERPVTDVKGVGPATAEKLAKAGVESVADLAAADVAEVSEASGIAAEKVTQYVKDAKDLLAGKESADDKSDGKGDEGKAADKTPKDETKAAEADESGKKA
ncbi:MAG TPA: 50S ribosomal protein L31e [Candidatus Thermoplasmatota archaeon]|nr:50S ribosomal protein L31e [Candidatus Thermoplasmatota archaeon]